MKDTGGWRSKGVPIMCEKCGEDSAMLETTIYGKTSISYFCNVCGHSGVAPREVKETGR